jgi:hypothetical protein
MNNDHFQDFAIVPAKDNLDETHSWSNGWRVMCSIHPTMSEANEKTAASTNAERQEKYRRRHLSSFPRKGEWALELITPDGKRHSVAIRAAEINEQDFRSAVVALELVAFPGKHDWLRDQFDKAGEALLP